MKTNTKKVIALLSLFGILIVNTADVFAVEQIGSISITGSGSTSINWDENFNGTNNASGSISPVKVIAVVDPILDMRLSADTINLGTITSSTNSGITIEVGTNSPSGVIVTATSLYGGLRNDSGVLINNGSGGIYTYSSSASSPDLAGGTSYLISTNITTTNQLVQVYASSGVENLKSLGSDDINFTVTAQAQASAPAGEYEDYITFTIIASF